jgi:uncharacterized protein YjbI with pentapeptide repeats
MPHWTIVSRWNKDMIIAEGNYPNVKRLVEAKIKQGVSFKTAFFQSTDFEGADLSNGDFENADFNGANLKFADLRNANFENASIIEADFRQANIGRIRLAGAKAFPFYILEETY